jgi:CTP synthase (UTP-ammonia lyase)
VKPRVAIGLVGDHDARVTAHRAIPLALQAAAQCLGIAVDQRWLPTERIHSAGVLRDLDGLWCVPASPYRSRDGALRAIRHAREQGLPFLGTCGGFQHAVLEFARHVLGWADAEHGETAPDSRRAVIAPLQCSLVEVRAIELDGHPFFVATLFQPERVALQGGVPPLALAFVRACAMASA